MHLNREVLKLGGDDRLNFLQGIITNNALKLAKDSAMYSLLLSPQGKYLHEFFIYNAGDFLLLDTPAERVSALVALLKKYRLRSKVTIDHQENARVYACNNSVPQADGLYVFADPRSAEMGYRVIADSSQVPNSTMAVEEYNLLRVKNRIPEGDVDMQAEGSFPLHFGMDKLNAIDFNKGCYVGQEVTARTHYRGVIRKGIYLLALSDDAEADTGTEVTISGNKLGIITSVAGNMALALLNHEDVEKLPQPRTLDQGVLVEG